MFDLRKLFLDVFHPESDERVVVVTDAPHGVLADTELWADRRQMAVEWRNQLVEIGKDVGFEVLPLVSYPASGAHNADLPLDDGDSMPLREALGSATLALALTEFSATAPMVAWSRIQDDFRCATLPGVARRMEKTALSADYSEVARRCRIIADLLDPAVSADVTFSTGHRWHVDLRYQGAKMDDGQLPRDKSPGRIINLPSGETFQVPYEGDRAGDGSRTAGEIPVVEEGEIVVLKVEGNRIVDVIGSGEGAGRLRKVFEADPIRGNIAEFAIGCNPMAVVWGSVLEDEKAGFHWAYGRSEHLGGTVGPDAFKSPETIVHQDIVYASESPIGVERLMLASETGAQHAVIKNGEYVIF